VQTTDAADVRLQRGQRVAIEPADAGDAVGTCPLLDGIQPPLLLAVQGDQHLAALDVGEGMLGAEVAQQTGPSPAQPGLERARRVVQARVHDPAVAPGLVPGQLGLLLQQGHGGALVGQLQPSGHRGTEDAAAHDGAAQPAHPATNRGASYTALPCGLGGGRCRGSAAAQDPRSC
jgi:hypothetical protein